MPIAGDAWPTGWYHPFLPWLPIAQAVPQAVPLARLLPTAGRCHRGDCEGEIGWNWCKMLVYVGKTHVWEWTGITLISFCQLGFGIACLFRSEHMLFCQLGLLWVVGLQLFLTKLSSGPMLWFWVLRFCFWCRASEEAPAVVSFWHYTKDNIIDEGGGGVGGGGVGWDNSVICCTFSCTCTHTSCYAAVRSRALAHIRHATLLYVLMHLHTYVMLRCCTFSCTCTHTSCYAAVRSHALAHIRHATLLYVLMHLHTYVMLRCCTFSCTCTHTSCYAAVRSHALPDRRTCRWWWWWWWRWWWWNCSWW